ncbi:MAG: TIGR02680 family protein [Streptosporangiales bacterium]|nr:TIGR02680 family protein [Streptosporangiales bacterium]
MTETSTPDRWRLHRAGVVNVWQYGEQEFDLSGGRVIFKGANGSGKSRTLELLLPLCLDGDLRHMGCKGFDTVSMRRLMLDHYEGGPNRIGYAWVELRRVTLSGEEFLTSGVGVKAAKSAGQISDSWRFVTPARVGHDVRLLGDDRVPLGPGALREALGAEHVHAGMEAFQGRVAEAVYGIREAHRYGDLLHLQRTLRNPDVGLKVLAGHLEQLLSDALPPLDPDVVARTAAGLDNLEGIRGNIVRLRRAHAALEEFLTGYRGYALDRLRTRGTALRETGRKLARAERGRDDLARRLTEGDADLTAAKRERDDAERRIAELDAELAELKSSPQYQALSELEDKARAVAALRKETEAALAHAAGSREQEAAAAETVRRALVALGRVAEGAREHADEAAAGLDQAGLGEALGPPPVPPEPTLGEVTDTVLTSADPQAAEQEIHRPVPPTAQPEDLRAAAAEAAERAGRAREAAAGRRPMITALRDEARRLAIAADRLDALRAAAGRAVGRAAEAETARGTATEAAEAAAREWAAEVAQWAAEGPLAGLPVGTLPAVPETPGPDDARRLQREIRTALTPPAEAAARTVADAEATLAALERRQAETHAELAAVRDKRDADQAAPPRTAPAPATRDPATGAPFYRLVDFAPGLTDPDRAGLEAALQASGLLDAWIPAPDGNPEASAASRSGSPSTGTADCDGATGPEAASALEPTAPDDGAHPATTSETARAALTGPGARSALEPAVLDADPRFAGANGAARGDVFAAPAQDAPSGPAGTLAELLVPAVPPDSPVDEETVAALLRSVRVGITGATGAADATGIKGSAGIADAAGAPDVSGGIGTAGTAVGMDGTWRTGVLRGGHVKAAAEFVGAGARAAARERRAGELEARLAELAVEVDEARRRLAEAEEVRGEWRTCLDALPDPSPLITAEAAVQARTAAATDARTAAETAEAEHATAQAAWQAEHGEHVRRAATAGLPAHAEDLQEAHDAVQRAVSALDRLHAALTQGHDAALQDLSAAGAAHEAAVTRRTEAERGAATAHAEHAAAAAALATLRASVGKDAATLSHRVEELTAERDDLRAGLPARRDRVDELGAAAARLRAELEAAARRTEERAGDVADAEDALTDASLVPGLWEAATGDAGDPPGDREAVLKALAAAPDAAPVAETVVINRIQALHGALAGSHDIVTGKESDLLTVTVSDEEGPCPAAAMARRTAERLTAAEDGLTRREQGIFEEFLLGDVAEDLRRQIEVARDLTRRMNEVLAGAHSSQGVHVQLSWDAAPGLDAEERDGLALVRTPMIERTPEQNERLRTTLADRIRAEREAASTGYAEVLSRALDYRQWYAYTVRVQDTGPDGKSRTRRVKQLSSGETRLVSYVTLFAASAAFYDALAAASVPAGGGGDGPAEAGPLRLALLDEAFERLDDPTIARLLELLVDLDMDWAITWPSGWGVSPRIPRMHIYDILKRKGAWGVACAHYTWNGSGFDTPEK